MKLPKKNCKTESEKGRGIRVEFTKEAESEGCGRDDG